MINKGKRPLQLTDKEEECIDINTVWRMVEQFIYLFIFFEIETIHLHSFENEYKKDEQSFKDVQKLVKGNQEPNSPTLEFHKG